MSNAPRNGSGLERTCQTCGRRYQSVRPSRYCSDACRQRAFRQRHAQPQPPTRRHLPRELDVLYECGDCGERYLNQRRCDDCSRFCRRLGPAVLCPSCDEPILLTELLGDYQMEVSGPR